MKKYLPIKVHHIYFGYIMKIEQFIKGGYFNKEYLQEQAGSSREE